MGKLIIISFITLDGVVEDPDGSDGTTGEHAVLTILRPEGASA